MTEKVTLSNNTGTSQVPDGVSERCYSVNTYCEELYNLRNNLVLIDYLKQTRQFICLGGDMTIEFHFMKVLTQYTEAENDGWGCLAKPTLAPLACQHSDLPEKVL